MKLYLDQDVCTGCELCTQIAPDTFQMSEDGLVAEIISQPDEITDDIQEAIDSCPVEAISFEE